MKRRTINRRVGCIVVASTPAIGLAQATSLPSAPPAAYSVGAAFDSARGRLVVFGGYLRGRYVGDTWEWDGAAWNKTAETGPSARNSPALVYDAKRGRVLLFGGVANGDGLGDTWEFDGEAWSRVATDGPPPRGLYAMTYDAARGRTVLFGGTTAPRPDIPSLGDTWEWDGRRWMRIDVAGPSARDHTQMVHDPTRRVVVLHGGGLEEAATETWTYDGRARTRTAFTGPSRRYATMAFDTRANAVVLDGGFAREPSNELWQLGDSGWRRVAP